MKGGIFFYRLQSHGPYTSMRYIYYPAKSYIIFRMQGCLDISHYVLDLFPFIELKAADYYIWES